MTNIPFLTTFQAHRTAFLTGGSHSVSPWGTSFMNGTYLEVFTQMRMPITSMTMEWPMPYGCVDSRQRERGQEGR